MLAAGVIAGFALLRLLAAPALAPVDFFVGSVRLTAVLKRRQNAVSGRLPGARDDAGAVAPSLRAVQMTGRIDAPRRSVAAGAARPRLGKNSAVQSIYMWSRQTI